MRHLASVLYHRHIPRGHILTMPDYLLSWAVDCDCPRLAVCRPLVDYSFQPYAHIFRALLAKVHGQMAERLLAHDIPFKECPQSI